MATGVSGSFTIKANKAAVTCRVNYSETYDVEANTSSVTVRVQFKAGTGGWAGYTYYLDGRVRVDGTTVVSCSSSAGNASVRWSALDSYATMKAGSASSWVKNSIAHDADGSKSITIAVDLTGYTTDGAHGNGWNVSGSKTIALTAIPRASDIGATAANIGAVSTVTVSRKSAAYSHSIAYRFGSLSGYLTAAGGVSASEAVFTQTSVAFAVPASFYAQIPNAKSGTCTLTCRTLSGSVQIGSPTTCSFTVTAAESGCAPVVSGTAVDANAVTKALTGDENRLVRYYSTALCTITATARNSAAIARRTIAGAEASGGSRTIPNVETASFLFSATDSRGYTASATVTKTLVDYVPLTCNGAVTRPSPTGSTAALALSGNVFNASFGAVSNALTVSYRVGSGAETALTPTLKGNTWSAGGTISGVPYTSSYTVTVTARDKLMTVTRTITLNRGVPVFDWGQNSFRVNVPLLAPGGVTGNISGSAGVAAKVGHALTFTGAASGSFDGSAAKTVNIPAAPVYSWDNIIGNRIQGGIVNIPCKTNEYVSKWVTFPKAFSSVPIVVATLQSSVPGHTAQGVGVTGVTTTGCNIYVYRTNTTSTNVKWLAVDMPAAYKKDEVGYY